MKAFRAAARALHDQGVQTMFGVMGDANMFMADSFGHETGGRYLAAAHERGAVLMAAGYAGVTGRVGAATVTHGAIANTTSALMDAVRARHPLVLIAGDTASEDVFHLQNVPQRDLVMPTGAGFAQVRAAETIVEDVAAAIRRASVERRPVVLNMPIDVQDVEIEYRAVRRHAEPLGPAGPLRVAVEAAIEVLAASRRPVVVAGRGAISPASKAAIMRLARRIGAPLATTLRGKCLFDGEPDAIGMCGTLATTIGLDAIAACDTLVVFGAGLNALTADGGDLVRGKRIVHCDSERQALGRYYPPDVGVVADAGAMADAMVALLDEAEVPSTGYSQLVATRQRADDPPRTAKHASGTVDYLNALSSLEDLIPTDRTLVIDGGRFSHESFKTFSVRQPQAYVHALSLGHIGLSVPYGIGAAAGAPERPTLVVIGDGGFMLGGLAEFNSAVRHGADLVVALLNDGAYGAEHYRFVGRSLDPSFTMFAWPDFADVATALGGHGVTVRAETDFDTVRKVIADRDRPVLIDVRLDPTAIPDPGRH